MNVHNAQKFTSFAWGLVFGGLFAMAAPWVPVTMGLVLVTVALTKSLLEE